MTTDLLSVADELYGLPPTEFTAARDEAAARAKLEGQSALAKQIGALRKPVAAAWVVNLLVRRKRAEVERLFAIADRLREAQRTGEGGELRELNKAAQAVVPAVVRMAGDLAKSAGRPVTEAVAGQRAPDVARGHGRSDRRRRGAQRSDGRAAGGDRRRHRRRVGGGGDPHVGDLAGRPRGTTRDLGSGRRGARAWIPTRPPSGLPRTGSPPRSAATSAAGSGRSWPTGNIGWTPPARSSPRHPKPSAQPRRDYDDLDRQRDEVGRKLREARAMVRSLEDDLEGIDGDRAAADRGRRTAEDRAARAERRADQAADEVERGARRTGRTRRRLTSGPAGPAPGFHEPLPVSPDQRPGTTSP